VWYYQKKFTDEHMILPLLVVVPTGGNIIPKNPVIKLTVNYQFRSDLGIIIS